MSSLRSSAGHESGAGRLRFGVAVYTRLMDIKHGAYPHGTLTGEHLVGMIISSRTFFRMINAPAVHWVIKRFTWGDAICDAAELQCNHPLQG